MTEQLTKIIQQNLKIYLAENNRQTEDGGGLRTSVELVGEDNLPFDPIGDISQSAGNVALALLYAAIDRDDAEPMVESGFIIAKPPENPHVSFLAFAAAYYGERRKNAINRVESYAIKTIESRMTLLSRQTANSRMVVAYQMPKEPNPKVGEVYCLDQEATGYDAVEEYIKIRKVETEIRRFFNGEKYIKRKLVKMEITQPLSENFVGAEQVKEDYQRPPCVIRETMIADAGRYYGVKQLAENAKAGDSTVKVTSIFEQIIPSSKIAVPLPDLDAGTVVSALKKTGNLIELPRFVKGEGRYTLPHAIAPNTLQIKNFVGDEHPNMTDNGRGIIVDKNGVACGKVNYRTKALEINTMVGNWQSCVGYCVAAQPRQVADTAAISIDATNQSSAYSITLDPPPLAGSVGASYRAGGNWYDLINDGTDQLVGAAAEYGTGRFDPITNTLIIETGALPDVGSEVIFSWATPVSYFDRSNVTVKPPQFTVELEHHTVAPNTVTVTYLGDNDQEKTASDDGAGHIIGDNFTAKIHYATGRIVFDYTNLPKGGVSYKINYSYGEQLHKSFPAPNRNGDGSITLDLEQLNIKPRTVKMVWNVNIETFDYISTTPAEMQAYGKVDPYITTFDSETGEMKDAEGVVFGNVNLATGIIKFAPDSTVKIPVGRYNVQHIGYDREQPRFADFFVSGGGGGGGSTPAEAEAKKVYKNTFSQWEYIDAGVSMPIGPEGKVDVWYSADDAPNTHEMTATLDALRIDVTPLYAETIVGGSVAFTLGDKLYTERDGRLYYDHNATTGGGTVAGKFNYQTGEAEVSAWTPATSAQVSLKSLLTTLDKNPIDEVVFRIPKAPIEPRSLQLRAVTLQGDNINIRADADGNLIGNHIVGRVEVADGVVRARFGEWVTAAGHENEIWYKDEAVVGEKIFKPMPVNADSIKYNATGYTYLPVDADVIGINTVRFPNDGRVPIYREGEIVVVGACYTQNLGTAFTDNQVIQLNQTGLTGCCLFDAKRKHVNAEKYRVDLDAGTVTIISASLGDYSLPLSADYCVEETRSVSHVDLSGALTLTAPLANHYDKAHTYVSSMMVGKNSGKNAGLRHQAL
ncbi:MAG: hypothetical protein CR974_03915 [Gammaproteobacteria bacterium]|nr:MAG: hypothetical protein CR974_03915 [Gammaproteobacteria bacterium]